MKLLLLHGIGGGAAIWAPVLQALRARGVDATALDLPGYGGQSGPATMERFAEAVDRAIGASGASPAVLCGHSMGGMVAQELVARSPQRARALVLACTSAAFGPPGGSWQARFVAERLAPLEQGLGMDGMARRLVPTLAAPGAPAAALELAREVMARVPEATYRSALEAIAGFDRREALARIGVPTLLIAAAHDRTAPPDVMRRMAERIPGSRWACLEDAGHLAIVEQPEAFAAALVGFLKSLPAE